MRLVALTISRYGGQLDHYFHFIYDFAWPVFRWLSNNNLLDRPQFWIASTDPGIATFAGIFREMFDVRLSVVRRRASARWVEIINTGEGIYLIRRKDHVRLRGFNPIDHGYLQTFQSLEEARESLRSFREYLGARYGLSNTSPEAVVLIEREGGDSDRGTSRRSIVNHAELATALAAYCAENGRPFRNVQLAKLSLREQVGLFGETRLVVGQHGAGLTNAMWMQPGRTHVLELAAHENRDHFINFCTDFNLPYTRMRIPSTATGPAERLIVNPAEVILEVDRALVETPRSSPTS